MTRCQEFCTASLVVLVLWAGAASADDHKRVAWDALEAGKAYMIRTEVHSHRHYLPVRASVVRFPGGGFFKVYERVTHEGALWYLTKWVKPRTIGDHDDIRGWIRADELRDHGAFVVRGYD